MTFNEKWPNFFIVGGMRCGSTSLYEYLKKIPGIYMSPEKEPYYFLDTNEYDRLIPTHFNKKQYLEQFHGVRDQKAVGEASPLYLTNPNTPRLIYKTIPNAKIIIILRDPVSRIFSNYQMYYTNKSTFNENRTFHEAIHCKPGQKGYDLSEKYFRFSSYYDAVKRYLDIFGNKNVKIILFDDLIQETRKTLSSVLKFLSVDGKLPNTFEIYNPTVIPKGKISKFIIGIIPFKKKISKIIPNSGMNLSKKILVKKATKQEISPEDKEFLSEYFQEDIKKLSSLIGRKLPWQNSN